MHSDLISSSKVVMGSSAFYAIKFLFVEDFSYVDSEFLLFSSAVGVIKSQPLVILSLCRTAIH